MKCAGSCSCLAAIQAKRRLGDAMDKILDSCQLWPFYIHIYIYAYYIVLFLSGPASFASICPAPFPAVSLPVLALYPYPAGSFGPLRRRRRNSQGGRCIKPFSDLLGSPVVEYARGTQRCETHGYGCFSMGEVVHFPNCVSSADSPCVFCNMSYLRMPLVACVGRCAFETCVTSRKAFMDFRLPSCVPKLSPAKACLQRRRRSDVCQRQESRLAKRGG